MTKTTRDRMIDSTARLLQHRGYHGTSLSDILAASGAPRGSLYFHFPGGKDQLVLEATQKAVDETTREIEALLRSAENPAQGVRKVIEATAHILRDTDYTFGCPVAPVVLDGPGSHPELAALCRAAFDTWLGLFQEAFEGAGVASDRAYRLAALVESSLEGLLLIGRANQDDTALIVVAEELETVVATAIGQGR